MRAFGFEPGFVPLPLSPLLPSSPWQSFKQQSSPPDVFGFGVLVAFQPGCFFLHCFFADFLAAGGVVLALAFKALSFASPSAVVSEDSDSMLTISFSVEAMFEGNKLSPEREGRMEEERFGEECSSSASSLGDS